ncbi:50S ribosomal protein L25 [Peptoniphilus catoniae]|uniref:50S ribosomal protein L25 n=1 Tax=Peptoniphilus catoniae TaxID=1660341 RepID=UPI0010FCF320|nr:50S ribosomal protein L25 [Peptoniphilus catoniae]
MSEMVLNLEKREEIGKNKVIKLRQDQKIPGVIYSKGKEASHVKAVEKELKKLYSKAGTSNIITINIDGEEQKALFKDVQNHPFKNQILHFDLFLVDMSEKLRVTVPIVLINRDDIRVQPSVLLQTIDEVEIECLPSDLPSEASIDVIDMQIGDSYTIGDLDIASNDKVEILTDTDEIVASLQEPREEEIGEEVEEVSADVPTVSETEAPKEEEE